MEGTLLAGCHLLLWSASIRRIQNNILHSYVQKWALWSDLTMGCDIDFEDSRESVWIVWKEETRVKVDVYKCVMCDSLRETEFEIKACTRIPLGCHFSGYQEGHSKRIPLVTSAVITARNLKNSDNPPTPWRSLTSFVRQSMQNKEQRRFVQCLLPVYKCFISKSGPKFDVSSP